MAFRDLIAFLVTQVLRFPISNVTKSNLQQKFGLLAFRLFKIPLEPYDIQKELSGTGCSFRCLKGHLSTCGVIERS